MCTFFLPSSSKVTVVFCLISFPVQSVVRTSDVRVSNRVNKAAVTLNKYPTVYNDLTGEVRYQSSLALVISVTVALC